MLLSLIHIFRMQQRTSEAVPELMTAAELSPQNASAQIERARALIANGNNAKAVPVLQQMCIRDSLHRIQKPDTQICG